MSYVQVAFPNGINNSFRGAFTSAANFWDRVITGGASTLTFSGFFNAQGLCGVNFQFSPGDSIRGLLIFAEVSPIDGVGGTLGRAGPCGFSGNFPRLGIMEFDSADTQNLVNNGSFEEVIRHEMAHVIGIGTTWSRFGLVRNPCTRVPCNTNPSYRGAQGNAGFRQLGGFGEIPVANTGGFGTVNGHWRESTFQNELMTGFLSAGRNPASIMTVRSLRDLGYSVNLGASESYSLPKEGDIAEVGSIEMIGDILDFEAVDIDTLLEKEAASRAMDMKVIVGVIAIAMAVLAALVALVAVKSRKRASALETEMKTQQEEEKKAKVLTA